MGHAAYYNDWQSPTYEWTMFTRAAYAELVAPGAAHREMAGQQVAIREVCCRQHVISAR